MPGDNVTTDVTLIVSVAIGGRPRLAIRVGNRTVGIGGLAAIDD